RTCVDWPDITFPEDQIMLRPLLMSGFVPTRISYADWVMSRALDRTFQLNLGCFASMPKGFTRYWQTRSVASGRCAIDTWTTAIPISNTRVRRNMMCKFGTIANLTE